MRGDTCKPPVGGVVLMKITLDTTVWRSFVDRRQERGGRVVGFFCGEMCTWPSLKEARTQHCKWMGDGY